MVRNRDNKLFFIEEMAIFTTQSESIFNNPMGINSLFPEIKIRCVLVWSESKEIMLCFCDTLCMAACSCE